MNRVREMLEIVYKLALNKYEGERFKKLEKVIDMEKIKLKEINSKNVISFIIPGMRRYSGGHTSILRLGTELSNIGYKVNYITYNDQSVEEMNKIAENNLSDFKGEFYSKIQLFKVNQDIVIATFWESAYYAKLLEGYKMYFIQDFEPYFYEYGEKYLLASKTYGLGFHMVSLGKWNARMIKRLEDCAIIDCIDFPYEKNEYSVVTRNFSEYRNKREINMAVYIKFNSKRAPYLIQNIICNLKKEFEKDKIKVNVFYFGDNKRIKLKGGRNLGKLTASQLYELYSTVDFGMVASLTNISLIPYEMIATGLPIIEFEEGTFKDFFNEKSAILTSFNYKDLYKKLKHLLENNCELKEIQESSLLDIKDLNWRNSAKQFHEIIQKI